MPSETRDQLLKHVARRPFFAAGRCIPGVLTLVILCCFTDGSLSLEAVRLFPLILWMYVSKNRVGTDISTYAPFCYSYPSPPPISAEISVIVQRSSEYSRGAHLACEFTLLKTQGCYLKCLREKQPKSLSLYSGFLLCYHTLIASLHGKEQS